MTPFAACRGLTLLFLLTVLTALSACVPGPSTPSVGQEPQKLWASFSGLAAAEPAPVRLEGSLRFGPQNDTRRVTYVIWNNGDLPLRMDVQAGVGVMAATLEVDGDTILVYNPRDNKAYIGTDSPDKALRALGLPLPLSVSQLNAFIQGRYLEALGQPQVLTGDSGPDGNTLYRIKSPWGESSLELSAQAKPLRWIIPHSWRVDIGYDESGLPSRLDALLPSDAAAQASGTEFRVVMLIKNRHSLPPFPPENLRLDLPSGVPVYNLDD